MSLFLDKLLSALAMPLGFALGLLACGIILNVMRARRSGLIFGVGAVALLWIASMPATARLLMASLEQGYPAQLAEAAPRADVIIVLGGGVAPPSAVDPYPDLGSASDRLFHALRLYKAGKAPRILLSGGQVFDPDAAQTEAQAMAGLLQSFGVPADALLVEGKSQTTHENARNSLPIWTAQGFRTGLLVTSSSHMRRALATFRKAGFTLEPAATDPAGGDDAAPFPLDYLPDATALLATTQAWKEILGLAVYRWRGWA